MTFMRRMRLQRLVARLRQDQVFAPILTGATLRDRLIGCLGALVGICLTGFVCSLAIGGDPQLPLIVAPMGASAVLLFAVPASPLAQPWPIVGGNAISALVGVAVAQFVADPMLAVGLAVALAILAMSLTRSLHPPGGAAALTAVIGGAAVARAGFWFPFMPVALNALILVALGILFHRLAGKQYPHRQVIKPANLHETRDPPPALRVGFTSADIDAAVAKFDETLDISRADLDALLRAVEQEALVRQHGALSCAEVMSRDVVTVTPQASPVEARRLLLEHKIRTLPVIDQAGQLIGQVGLREIAAAPDATVLPVAAAVTCAPDQPAVALLPVLTDGISHIVVITDDERHVLGVVSQTDLLATMAKSLAQVSAGKPIQTV
jgi:CBS domain-containing membrane protein